MMENFYLPRRRQVSDDMTRQGDCHGGLHRLDSRNEENENLESVTSVICPDTSISTLNDVQSSE